MVWVEGEAGACSGKEFKQGLQEATPTPRIVGGEDRRRKWDLVIRKQVMTEALVQWWRQMLN